MTELTTPREWFKMLTLAAALLSFASHVTATSSDDECAANLSETPQTLVLDWAAGEQQQLLGRRVQLQWFRPDYRGDWSRRLASFVRTPKRGYVWNDPDRNPIEGVVLEWNVERIVLARIRTRGLLEITVWRPFERHLPEDFATNEKRELRYLSQPSASHLRITVLPRSDHDTTTALAADSIEDWKPR